MILVSKEFEYNEKLLIMIQWAGYVKIDEWEKSVCINEGLMILFVEIANKRNFSCLIMNKNERYDYYKYY